MTPVKQQSRCADRMRAHVELVNRVDRLHIGLVQIDQAGGVFPGHWFVSVIGISLDGWPVGCRLGNDHILVLPDRSEELENSLDGRRGVAASG